ncbi:DUF6076 domain-containing protein [Lachnoclostridium sp. MSJ-17]|uniref:DUF6076 domain-containing protein n=1 Tax=Lachnoclostridium sp. MSJ-17 TaxID=2841516 RepID=UPI001C1033B3|nr:DUF6076 domain-containing protein [Lachnoclostridium sp. MSJ-17]MBU5461984.1 hypothetical protein [Lachnoclostridium sp. MSJ-17]
MISLISTDSDAIQIALSYVNQEPVIEKRYSPARAERIFTQNLQVVKIFRSINTILGLLLNAELSKIEKPSPDDRRGYEKAIDLQRKIYRDCGAAFQNVKVLTNIYAELPCPLEEKPKRILEIDKQLLDNTFQETYYINKKKQTESDLGLTKCYIFDSAANYLNFLLLNLIQLNPNICLCQNCGDLFVAKTKKKTLYCDRIQPDSKKTCSEIGPKKRAELQSTLFGFEDYDMAVERNYQRAKRTAAHYVKDIRMKWDDYFNWLEKAQQAKQQWLNDEISDDDFLNIIHELD